MANKQMVNFREEYLETLSQEEYYSIYISMRILSEINRKVKSHRNAIENEIYNNSERIDSFCDVFSTFHEGAKTYFQTHVNDIHSLASLEKSDYVNKMIKIYDKENKDIPKIYEILKNIRDTSSFHFKNDFMKNYLGKKKIKLIGFIYEKNKRRFSNYVPYFTKYLKEEIGIEENIIEIGEFFNIILK